MKKMIFNSPAQEDIPGQEKIEGSDSGLRILTKKWLTIDDVCWILGVSKRTLQNYRDQRRIPYYQVGRKIYFKGLDVDEFLEAHHVKSVKENRDIA
jgi:excisionase family DNA binding protein